MDITDFGNNLLREQGFAVRLLELRKRKEDDGRPEALTHGEWLALWPAESWEVAKGVLLGADWQAVESRWCIDGWIPEPILSGYMDGLNKKCSRRPLRRDEIEEWARRPCWATDESLYLLNGLSPVSAITALDLYIRVDAAEFPEPILAGDDEFMRARVAGIVRPLSNTGFYSPSDVIKWAAQNNIGCAAAWSELFERQAAEAGPVCQTATDATKTTAKPVPAQRLQEQEVLRVIAELGYTANSLPKTKAGKSGVKAIVKQKLNYSTGVFNKAWERLRGCGDIADA